MPRPHPLHPSNDAFAAAMRRALTALDSVLQVLGDGAHTLSLMAVRTDGSVLHGQADLSVGSTPPCLAVLDPREFAGLRAVLLTALDGTDVRHAVLIATTAGEPRPRACGWTVRARWLHPIEPLSLQDGITECPDPTALRHETYAAPTLPRPHESEEENPLA
ncbi:hypothetical protein [Streptomyces sp. V3I7]|uniref:hypothetical protein n=1 Tax=Streptomyces sp. V3I7 TaxID=3042278 RepID=UPI002788F12B|nr:hypothetical protein [Streptomyces sp. V3I7]MDQ0994819.1 hypothetical protein [Streptomyces sp. V3I7]